MSESDFEKQWISKFSDRLDRIAGEEISKRVLRGSEKLASGASRKEIIDWTAEAMHRLDALVDENKRIEIMTGCACRYPESDLEEIKKAYEDARNIDQVHGMLKEKFFSFLKNTLKLDDQLVKEIMNREWGLAGVKKGNTILATKIPKSSNLIEYMNETDPEKRRALYCHCPRIRDAVESQIKISPTYCYCGAGFYKAIWEYMLQKPVKVELLESVLRGDDVCKIAIHLPAAD
jgi:predicted hydrocarbon binding protein